MRKDKKDSSSQCARTKEDEHEVMPMLVTSQDARGVYANLALIRHTQREFVFDFIFQINGQAQLVSRVITSPDHARALLTALSQNIENYEKECAGD